MDDQQKISVHDLGTRSVTLFPDRAQVTRDIRVGLGPGTTEVIITGLDPSVDKRFVKIKSSGCAIIDDVTVETRPNCDKSHDVCPDMEFEDQSDSEDRNDGDHADFELPELKENQDQIAKLHEEQNRATETIVSAQRQCEFLDSYNSKITSSPPKSDKPLEDLDITTVLENYRKERSKLYETVLAETSKKREIEQKISDLARKQDPLRKRRDKQQAMIQKNRAKMLRAKEKRSREIAQLRREEEHIWPERIHVIKVSLFNRARAMGVSDLELIYDTRAAYWSPSYNLSFSSTTKSTVLRFDAHITNMTSETWSNCRVTLADSRGWYSGLEDDFSNFAQRYIKFGTGKAKPLGYPNNYHNPLIFSGGDLVRSRLDAAKKSSLNENLKAMQRPTPSPALVGADRVLPPPTASLARKEGPTGVQAYPELGFQESPFEETDLGSIYELKGLKSLAPSPDDSKHIVTHIVFKSVNFSRIVVSMHKPSAYIRAEILNDSRVYLMDGPVGLVMDGVFIRRAELPYCIPGGSFTLGLCLDPEILVEPSMPEFTRTPSSSSTAGQVVTYKQTVKIFNTCSRDREESVQITVIDPSPIDNKDGNVYTRLVQPPGLTPGGPGVEAGVGIEGKSPSPFPHWGKATAALTSGGDLAWDVTLNAGKGVEMTREYCALVPHGRDRGNVLTDVANWVEKAAEVEHECAGATPSSLDEFTAGG
ncbi:hypothetical protein PFICI_12834 [Pestalotiopsis fici W106-1]|uniref:DUF4139 domain-containing protein n=1 Tax=Pestalotiopsis fici (strain W106-1 / CGMCC3.15140) TaxID=1229662 RepID=W3WPR5_PESFW|nr:uncharacterized protein PFICI_12834 [Pestalotiopsis fici W106-1]ETS75890.1 hypothetical protein PFICI_12834 [Pestalotiopsis fici W106-1]